MTRRSPTPCLLDLFSAKVLQAISSSVLLSWTHVTHSSRASGLFLTVFKQAKVLKKDVLNGCHRIDYWIQITLPSEVDTAVHHRVLRGI